MVVEYYNKSLDDLERILEDYFGVIPSDIDMNFKLELVKDWEFDPFDYLMTFYFENEWDAMDFFDVLTESPKAEMTFTFDEFGTGLFEDEKKVVIKGGEDGGLL